jgi:hypothetical protein
MKWEMRHIRASFLTGCSEGIIRVISKSVFNYSPLWIDVIGVIGLGMMIYSGWMYYFYKKEIGGN